MSQAEGPGPKGFQEIVRQAHSLTWRSETRRCEDCGQEFTLRVATDQDGRDLPSMTVCDPCDEKRRRATQFSQLKLEAEHACLEGRSMWVGTLPAGFRLKTFANFNRALQRRAFEALSTFSFTAGRSLILMSPNLYGVGKTHLACALAHKLFDEVPPAVVDTRMMVLRFSRQPAIYISERSMLSRIRQTYDRKDRSREAESEEDIYTGLEAAPLLIIDDVGKVRPKELNFLQSVYFEIIDQRYNDGRPVVMTTNLSAEELEEHLGGACADRLREMCGGKAGFIIMGGSSYRRHE